MPSPEENRALVLADAIQREAVQLVGLLSEARSEPDPTLIPVTPPKERIPYFDIGEATGKAGDVVELSVEGGCQFDITGFNIGGGCGKLDIPRSGYRLFEAVGVKLGPFLRGYLEAEDLIHDEPMHRHDHFWSGFQMVKKDPNRALPEEWWKYTMGFFSLGQRKTVSPTTIPSGTELFTLQVKILEGTAPGEYEVTCLDEHYYTSGHQRRQKFMFTAGTDSPFGRGGVTKLETFPGQITVQ